MKYVMYVIMGILAVTVVILAFMTANKPPVVEAEGVVVEEEDNTRERELLFSEVPTPEEDEGSPFNPENMIEEIIEEEDPDPDIIKMDVLMYTIDNVNIRMGPSVDYEKLGYILAGTVVHVTGQSRETNWYRIQYGEGDGFLSNNYVEARDSDPTAVPNEETGGDVPEETLPEPDF
ncbi:MAG: SH3 domain-containing protein [Lachnospiraceae bacterium]|jgi:uncharacterized protein YgiM (DUF1202 family)|nr:SH3 domain-containing protein [Lachnospiraceae bacterium]